MNALTGGYKFLELWFPDLFGRLMSVSVAGSWLDNKMGDGISRKNFDGSSVKGFATIDDSDLWLIPEMETLRALPWRKDTAALFCSVEHPADGLYKEGDTRYCLRNLLHRHLTERYKGHELLVSVELEFFVFDHPDSTRWVDLDAKGYFDLPSLGLEERFLEDLIQNCDAMQINYEQIHHEAAKSQFEIVLNPMQPLKAADEIMRARHVVRNVACQWGHTADFAPKPNSNQDGSGLHVSIALLTSEGKDALGTQEKGELSLIGRSFVSGLRLHGRELMPTTNQWVNSYKRLQRGFDAPLYLEASRGLKHTAIQIKKPLTDEKPLLIELTHPDAGCNPYLALAGLIGAGLSNEDDPKLPIYTSQNELDSAKKLIRLPGSLREALEEFERSNIAPDIFGDKLWQKLLDEKNKEWERFAKAVTDWERLEYLPVL